MASQDDVDALQKLVKATQSSFVDPEMSDPPPSPSGHICKGTRFITPSIDLIRRSDPDFPRNYAGSSLQRICGWDATLVEVQEEGEKCVNCGRVIKNDANIGTIVRDEYLVPVRAMHVYVENLGIWVLCALPPFDPSVDSVPI